MVAELANHPAWLILHEIAKQKMDKEFHRLAVELMRGEMPDDLGYRRGFFAGMKFLLRRPLLESDALEKALKGVEVDA